MTDSGSPASDERLLILEPGDDTTGPDVRAEVESAGGQLLQAYGTRAWLIRLPAHGAARVADHARVEGLFDGPVPEDVAAGDETARLAIAAWNARQGPAYRAAKARRIGEGRSWGDPEFEREGSAADARASTDEWNVPEKPEGER
jgi:hypothetical protein